MTLVIDENRIYTTRYTSNENRKCLQKTVELEGKKGSRIKISELSLLQYVEVAGTKCTVIISAEKGGREDILITWEETKTTPQEKNLKLSYLAADGEPVTLRWYIISSSNVNKAIMKRVAYDYSYIPVEVAVEADVYLMIPCVSIEEANEIKSQISGIVTDIDIFVKD